MSKITGKTFGESFQMRVVSGMLVGGSIQVTWATGEPASSQLDWGLTPDNLSTTPEYNAEPQEMVRYHRLWFPITYLDAKHYFRVRSRSRTGRTGQSNIYFVITPDKVETSSDSLSGSITLDLRVAGIAEGEIPATFKTLPNHKSDPVAASERILFESTAQSIQAIYDQPESANARTNPILNIL